VKTTHPPINHDALSALISPPTSDDVADLRRHLLELRQKHSYFAAVGKIVPAVGMLIFVLAFASYIFGILDFRIAIAVGAFYLTVAVVFRLFTNAGELATEIEAVESEIALRQTGADATEQRAERLFKSHEIDLRRYYQQTLRHSTLVFAAGFGCMAIGFSVVGYTFFLLSVGFAGERNFNEKMLVAAFGLISGVLTNFVAAVYMKMFAETMSALTGFHKKLVTTNHLHFANLLLAKISDPKHRDESYARLAERIAGDAEMEKRE
jgi:hypothetical protein